MNREFPRWLKRSFPEWKWNWKYQRYVYERLERVTGGKCRRLMIFMPPRHGKSETVTVRYTAWRLLQDPKLNVILGSYNQRLADRFSRKIKRIFTAETPRRGASEKILATNSHEKTRIENNNDPLRLGVSAVENPLNSASDWETPAGGCVRG